MSAAEVEAEVAPDHDLWSMFDGLADDDERGESAQGVASPASAPSRPATVDTGAVGAWLRDWAAGPDSALLGGEYRFVRQQVMGIAKRIAAVNEREKRAQQRRRYRAEAERQRSATQLLPPNEITTGTLHVNAIMQAANSDAVVALTPASATTDGSSGGSTAVAVSGTSASGGISTLAVSGASAPGGRALWRREPRPPKAVKAHLRPDAAIPASQMNRHQLQDVTRTVRQLRHLTAHRCYVCKAPLEEQGGRRHATFTNHCHGCGELNAQKRHALVDLRGRIAVLTGARIKIGYQIGVRLLRCGATLLATSRFPANALLRYQAEPDYEQWKSRLHLLYADLCNPAEVVALADRIKALVPHVDILINNAAQTVRRPLPYYEQLNRIEMESKQRLLQIAQETHTPIAIEPHPPVRLHEAPPLLGAAAAAAAATPRPLTAATNSPALTTSVPPAAAPAPAATAAAPASSTGSVQLADAHETGCDAEIDVRTPAAAHTVVPAPAVTPAAVASTSAPAPTSEPAPTPAAPHDPAATSIASAASATGAPIAAEPSDSCSSAPVDRASDLSSTALSTLLPSASASAPPPLPLPALNTLVVSGCGAVEVPQRRFSPFSLIPSLDVLGAAESAALFPPGRVDTTNDHEPLDLRAANSWNMRTDEVDPRELAEVLSTNAMAPFVLSQQLRAHMRAAPSPARYLILVSSMEGRLNRCKVDMHVHTNMAKASLNAFTRTAAADYATDGIYMNSVDTGWNSEERAVNDPKRAPEFETPLDCADGAARVLDPIFVGETEKRYIFGQFLKDYSPGDW